MEGQIDEASVEGVSSKDSDGIEGDDSEIEERGGTEVHEASDQAGNCSWEGALVTRSGGSDKLLLPDMTGKPSINSRDSCSCREGAAIELPFSILGPA